LLHISNFRSYILALPLLLNLFQHTQLEGTYPEDEPLLPELELPELELELPELLLPPFPPFPPPPLRFHRSLRSASAKGFAARSCTADLETSWMSVMGCGCAIVGVEVRRRKPRANVSTGKYILNACPVQVGEKWMFVVVFMQK
jgi:hypothetical protein